MIIFHLDRSAPIQRAKVTEREIGHLYISESQSSSCWSAYILQSLVYTEATEMVLSEYADV